MVNTTRTLVRGAVLLMLTSQVLLGVEELHDREIVHESATPRRTLVFGFDPMEVAEASKHLKGDLTKIQGTLVPCEAAAREFVIKQLSYDFPSIGRDKDVISLSRASLVFWNGDERYWLFEYHVGNIGTWQVNVPTFLNATLPEHEFEDRKAEAGE